MQLTQYQIDLYGFTESQVEFINGLIKLSHTQGINEGINEINLLKSK